MSGGRIEHALAAFLRQEFGAPVAAIIGLVDILIEDARQHELPEFVSDLAHCIHGARRPRRVAS